MSNKRRFLVDDEEGSMQLASELVDLGLTWDEAQKELSRMTGAENLQDVAKRVIDGRSKINTRTPPR